MIFLIYNLGFTHQECEKAWERALEDFPNAGLLTQEVVTRDILRGDLDFNIETDKEFEENQSRRTIKEE